MFKTVKIEGEIELGNEIRTRILEKKENIAIARVQVKNGGTSFSYGPAENHHKEEHC